MEFAFSGIDNADLRQIFPKDYDTVCDDDGNEWLFYGNEWTLCGEGLSWQLPDQDPIDYPPYGTEWILCDEGLSWQLPDQDPLDYPPYDYDYDL